MPMVTCQGGDIPPGASTHKFELNINGVVIWGHMTNKIYKGA